MRANRICICLGLFICITSGITIIGDLRDAEKMKEYAREYHTESVYMPKKDVFQKSQEAYNYKFPMTFHEISELSGVIFGAVMLYFGVLFSRIE